MEAASKPTPPRRTLLQRGLALVAAGAGLGFAGRRVEAALAPPPPAPVRAGLTFYGRRRHSPAGAPSATPSAAQHVIRFGEILDGPEGRPVGRFYVNGFCQETPFGPHLGAASNLEFHSFHLPEGTLFGMGAAGAAAGGERTYVILGGTGRFAGAGGSYVEREAASVASGPGGVQFVVSLTS